MSTWTVTVKVTNCATGQNIPNVLVDSPVGSNWTNQYGEVGYVMDSALEFFIVRLRHNDHVAREQTIPKSAAGTTVTICLNPITTGSAPKPIDVRVTGESAGHVSLAWTNPVTYQRVHVGWSRPGGPHHQLDTLPGGTVTATIRAGFTPGDEYDLKVQGLTSNWSHWTQIRWRCPAPDTPRPTWFQQNNERLGGTILASSVGAVSWGANRIDAFHGVKGNPKLLGHTWWDGGRWNNEQMAVLPHGGDVYGFAAASRGPGRLDVFYHSQRQIWHLVFDGTWREAYSIGGTNTKPGTQLAAVSWGGERLDLFYAGENEHLMQRYYDGGWSGEVDLGGNIHGSRPAAASWGENRLDVFYRARDSTLRQTWWDGRQWNTTSLGGAVKGDVAAVSWGHGRLDIFVQGQANDRMFQYFHDNGRWSGEIDLGAGPVATLSGLTVASWAPHRLDMFYTSLSNEPSVDLWHHWYSA